MEFLNSSLVIKRLSYLALVSLIALFFYLISSAHESYWIVLSALLLGFATPGATFTKRMVLLTLMGSVMIGVIGIIGALSQLPVPFFITLSFICLTTVIIILLTIKTIRYFYPFFAVNFTVVLAAIFPVASYNVDDRLIFVTGGVAIALFLQIIFFRRFTQDKLGFYIMMLMQHLNRLIQEIFATLLNESYSENVYLFEKRIHAEQQRALWSAKKVYYIASLLGKKGGDIRAQSIQRALQCMQLMFDMVQDLALLRFRVTDPAVFSICQEELRAIKLSFDMLFSQLSKFYGGKKNVLLVDTARLEASIQQFESIYLSVLQVTAPEPVVMMLYLTTLKALQEQLQIFMTESDVLKNNLLKKGMS
ncbi:MAG: FUSC family protein [Gammaproteobacteria bacterium]|nr:FUSC family protein [Gammaproteobacteria bacterium]